MTSDKIKIPSKKVVEQKNELQLKLNKLFKDVVCEKSFEWMKAPLASEVVDMKGVYKKVYEALVNYRGHTSFIKRKSLQCDFVIESKKLIIEYDERQHFSEARRISLLAYKSIPVNYDRKLWITACTDIMAKDNDPIDRDETRAYYDSMRDILASKNGYTLIRIMHGQVDFKTPESLVWLKRQLREQGISISRTKKNG